MRRSFAAMSGAVLALLVLSGCHLGTFATSYSVEWPKASNEVRAIGNALLAEGRKTWHDEATFDLDPAYFKQKHTGVLAATFMRGGYLRNERGRFSFTPPALAASVPCGEPEELGVDCRRFALGRLSDIRITDYSYQSKTFETGVAFRTLGFVFRVLPATPVARLLEAHGGLVCTVGYKTTKVVLAGDSGTSTSPILRPWTRRLWCEGVLQQTGDDVRPATMGPEIPLPLYFVRDGVSVAARKMCRVFTVVTTGASMSCRTQRAFLEYAAFAVIAFSALAATFATAATKPVSAYSACMSKAESTLDMHECQKIGLANAESRLATAYAATLAKLPADQQAKLRKAETLWRTFRDSDCQVFYGNETGTIATVRGGSCMIERTERRIEDMHGFTLN